MERAGSIRKDPTQTAAEVLEARKALLLFLSVRSVVYEKGPVTPAPLLLKLAENLRYLLNSKPKSTRDLQIQIAVLLLVAESRAVRTPLTRCSAGFSAPF